MTNQIPDRPRIYSIITRSRFLHIEDALEINKVRFFIGSYTKGQGSQATAYHFLDLDDARVVFLDMSWARELDIKDYKGSANGDKPVSRVLKIRGPKEGKYWLEIQNGPGQVIGQGAVKPAGDPDVSISIALTTWEARKLGLSVIEYMTAYRVSAINSPPTPQPPPTPPTPRPPRGRGAGGGIRPEKDQAGRYAGDSAVEGEEPADAPTAFYDLAHIAVTNHGLLDLVQELVKAPGSWRDKAQRLQAAMAA